MAYTTRDYTHAEEQLMPLANELINHDAHDLAALVRKKEVTPLELVEAMEGQTPEIVV